MEILPEFKSLSEPETREFSLDSRGLSRWVGYCAIGLPFVMIYGVYSDFPFGKVCFASSISHFYFTQGYGDIFVGFIFFIAIFLYNYTGRIRKRTFATTVAGFMALGIALFPTEDAPCIHQGEQARVLTELPLTSEPFLPDYPVAGPQKPVLLPDFFMATEVSSKFHSVSAAAFFVFLGWFSLFVFTKTDDNPIYRKHLNGPLTDEKKRRNRIYRLSGTLIYFSILAISYNAIREYLSKEPWIFWEENHLLFWFESLALVAFGMAWLVHGRVMARYLDDPPVAENNLSAEKSQP